MVKGIKQGRDLYGREMRGKRINQNRKFSEKLRKMEGLCCNIIVVALIYRGTTCQRTLWPIDHWQYYLNHGNHIFAPH